MDTGRTPALARGPAVLALTARAQRLGTVRFATELLALLLCALGTGYLLARHPRVPDFMTPEADRPLRECVRRARRLLHT